MKINVKWLWSLLVLPVMGIGLQACGPKPKDQPDCGFLQNVYGERISWKTNAPIELYLHESVPPEMYPAIEAAIQTWEQSAGRPMFRIAGYRLPGALAPKQDGVNVIYWMNTWEAEKASEQARTSVYWVGDQIREADIRVNDKNFNFYLSTPVNYSDVHLQSLLVHELGHVIGLRHKDDTPSVMQTYLASQTMRVSLSDGDKENLKCEY